MFTRSTTLNKKGFISMFLAGLFLMFSAPAFAETLSGNVQVSAEVLGIKPIVYSFSPTTNQNDGSTVITAIVGRNLSGAIIATLDDDNSTALSGTITIVSNTDNDATVAGVGAGGTYQKITGLSIPAGITPGVYNILITTNLGTNIASDTKLTVSSPPVGANTQISSVSPNPVMSLAGGTSSVRLNVNDSDSSTTYYHITANGGSWDNSTGSISLSANEGSTFINFTAGITPGVFTNTFKVDDNSGVLPGTFDDSKNVNFYVQPPW